MYVKRLGFNTSKLRSQLNNGEYLRARISIPGNISKPFINKQGSTLVHETQHIRLMYRDILKYGFIWYSGAEQHYFMKQPGSRWYNERFIYWRESESTFTDKKIETIINNFEYGWL